MDTQQQQQQQLMSMSSNYLGQTAVSMVMMLKMSNGNISYVNEDEYNATMRRGGGGGAVGMMDTLVTTNGDDVIGGGMDAAASSFFHPSNLTYNPWLSLIILVVAVLMSLTTIIGNVLVITAFIIEKSLRKYSNYFILNLSIADLLIGILIPPYAPFLLLKRTWRIGRTACTVWLVLDYVVGSASVLCIVVISLDRYLLVSRGLDYVTKQKVSRAIIIMVTVWVIAFLNYAPAIVFWEMITGVQTVKDGECQVAFHDNLYYLTATACVEFFAPLISICGLNLAVYLNIKKRSRGLIRSENPQFTVNKESSNNNANKSMSNTNNNNPPSRSRANTGGGERKSGGERESNDQQNGNNNNNNKERTNKMELSTLSSGKKTTSFNVSNGAANNNNNNNNNNNTSSPSRSSSSDSSLSLDEAVMLEQKKHEQQQQQQQRGNKPEELSNGKNGNGKKRIKSVQIAKKTSVIRTRNVPSSDPALMVTTTAERTRVISTSTTTSYNRYNKSISINSSTSRTLTKDKKAARSLFILVFVFGFCWAPYTFLTLIKSVCSSCVNEELHEFTFWLLWFNSTVNPMIYPLLHVKFRKAFAKILHSVFFCFKFKKKRRQHYREVSTCAVASTAITTNRRLVIEI